VKTYVINLERRPDRRAAMEEQASRLGLPFHFVRAVDVLGHDEAELRRQARRGPMGDLSTGDICCHLSHRDVWRRIVEGDDEHAAVLEDDAVLAGDAAGFLSCAGWTPPGAGLVKLESFGNRRHRILVSRQGTPVHGRTLHALFSKHVGSAGYVIRRDTAQLLLEASPAPSLAIDQLLFNPNVSPLFRLLKPSQVLPAIVIQGGPSSTSDIHAFRVSQRTYDARYWRRELRRGVHEIKLLPWHAALLATGRGKVVAPRYAAAPERTGSPAGEAWAASPVPGE
jgi:glycosyl transferase family 25